MHESRFEPVWTCLMSFFCWSQSLCKYYTGANRKEQIKKILIFLILQHEIVLINIYFWRKENNEKIRLTAKLFIWFKHVILYIFLELSFSIFVRFANYKSIMTSWINTSSYYRKTGMGCTRCQWSVAFSFDKFIFILHYGRNFANQTSTFTYLVGSVDFNCLKRPQWTGWNYSMNVRANIVKKTNINVGNEIRRICYIDGYFRDEDIRIYTTRFFFLTHSCATKKINE